MKSVKTKPKWALDLGANYLGDGITRFRVWAPKQTSLFLVLENEKVIPMQREEHGYFSLDVDAVAPLDLYYYRLSNGLKRPDPVSRSLPRGIEGPTQIIDPNSYQWQDQAWRGIKVSDAIIYELHVGTFTEEGTFEGVISKLDYLLDLGINMLEIMPVAQFPGKWNWGYDGVSLYTPFSGYGGVNGLKKLIDHAHQKGIAICLDVVYNHLGPEGNFLSEFGNYFSKKYYTPWGQTFNFDGRFADEVRHYIISNALYWATEYHIDALRLDAIQGIFDFSAQQILPALSEALPIPLIAESSLNDARHVRPLEVGGANLAAIWNDDFHHSIHTAFTSERHNYYQDYSGFYDLARTVRDGFAYNGRYSINRRRTYGNDATGVPYERFVICNQNHDQIGNRVFGERLIDLVGKDKALLAAYLTLASPFTPLLFMGEEYGEERPFEYFVDFTDKALMRSIYEGRKREFRNEWIPYPGGESFENSKLSWIIDSDLHKTYQQLIALRKTYPLKKGTTVGEILAYCGPQWIAWEYPTEKGPWLGLFCSISSDLKITLPFEHVQQKEILLSTQPIDLKEELHLKTPFALLVI